MVSTIRCIGAFEPCASSTIRTIWASAVSPPTFSARLTKPPVPLRAPPVPPPPPPFSAGMDSPVSMLSSSAERPSTTTPSTGTFSPGRTRTRSPTRPSPTPTPPPRLHPLTRPHPREVPDPALLDRNVPLLAVTDHARRLRPEPHERLYGGTGLPLGPRLPAPPQPDQP